MNLAASACPFCQPDPRRVFYRDDQVVGLWDGFPVSPGHALLVPVQHVADWFAAEPAQQQAIMAGVAVAREQIELRYGKPDGYNVGINVGAAGGQTVFHLHVHVIPRWNGDVPDPRGGVRHVIPDKANYIKDGVGAYAPPPKTLFSGGGADPLLPALKHHLDRSIAVDIAVAFTLRSGLALLRDHLLDLLERGGRLRLLTGDYLDATDPDALMLLLDLPGDVQCRVYQTTAVDGRAAVAFHPKAYLFSHADGSGAVFVGSSNLSSTALTRGVEWNHLESGPLTHHSLMQKQAAFDALFSAPQTTALNAEWISAYRVRRSVQPLSMPLDRDEAPPSVQPHEIQVEALQALQRSRSAGQRKGLVVLATGLGKTWLAAFDSLGFKRVLFVAHREEILSQALDTFRRVRPEDSLGKYNGLERAVQADVLFASVQTLARSTHLQRFAADAFDYIVIDEFHHAEARTYGVLLEHFTPQFLLGLTATPERSDGADLLTLCDDNLVYRCDVAEGIRRERLCPFVYFGVPDVADYSQITWRRGRFDEAQLSQAVQTRQRANHVIEQHRLHAGKRTLVFCVSQSHADFMSAKFSEAGLKAVAVHTGTGSAPRAASLQALREGDLAVICAVDLFNEGVDMPELDTVMMLRPTESRIVWLQQFGRGLRLSQPGKRLTVIDYIGNHRSFLLKPQALFGTFADDYKLSALLADWRSGLLQLPPGCEVHLDLQAVDILQQLLQPSSGAARLQLRYQDFLRSEGVRPTAVQLLNEGYNPAVVRAVQGSWVGFVISQGDLPEAEIAALTALRPLIDGIETTPMTRCYKMPVLLALWESGRWSQGVSLAELGAGVRRIAQHDARLAGDLKEALIDDNALRRMLRSQPIPAWVNFKSHDGRPVFEFQDGVFRCLWPIADSHREVTDAWLREIIGYRLAQYFRRAVPENGFVIRVGHNGSYPILHPLNRRAHQGLPIGLAAVRIGDESWQLKFAKVAVNVGHSADSTANDLPALLRSWFGADAGQSGTAHQVRLWRESDGWVLEPWQ
jgi:superfamily II DNA or RNA helicase/diadenosine tetraphosphate (Ap4A) HIT family hydrolase